MIIPVLLCGGSGTRLWPLSRKSYPKQFARLLGPESLFQASARRLSGPDFAAPVVITNSDFRFIVTEQLAHIGIDPGAVLIEPEGRNTAPAILAAALWCARHDPGALVLAAPSDHAIPDPAAFQAVLEPAAEAARNGRLVTFGISPDRPETGYGWLELKTAPTPSDTLLDLIRFAEKPDAATARTMLDEGRFLWNAGIFLFAADTILAAFKAHAPDLVARVEEALDNAQSDLGFLRLAADPWAQLPNISIDYAVMEQADNLSVVPYTGCWSDLGDWQAVWREMDRDGAGVATAGNALAIDCSNSLLRSEADGVQLIGIGLDNTVAVAMPDAVLVVDRARAQDVRLAVPALRARGAGQAETFPQDFRPWGWLETLVRTPQFQVRRLTVHPGAALSLQEHEFRSEHWVVVAGAARVTIDDTVTDLGENESIYVPSGMRHRLENPGQTDMILIEVQTGVYLGEDDVIRYTNAQSAD